MGAKKRAPFGSVRGAQSGGCGVKLAANYAHLSNELTKIITKTEILRGNSNQEPAETTGRKVFSELVTHVKLNRKPQNTLWKKF